MILESIALSFALATPSTLALQAGAAPAQSGISMDQVYAAALAKKDDAAIEKLFKERPYEVIGMIDGHLETWLANVEGKAEGNEKVANPQSELDAAIEAAARADKALGGDGYSRYAKAWKGWTADQQKQFRKGQEEFHAGQSAQKAKNLDEAKKHYDESLKLAAPLGDLWGEAQAHQALGDLAFGANDFDGAIAHHKKGAEIFGSIRHTGMLRSYRALGSAYQKKGDNKSAREQLEKMLKIAEEAHRPKKQAVPVMKDLAKICADLGDAAAAKKYEAEAAAIEKSS